MAISGRSARYGHKLLLSLFTTGYLYAFILLHFVFYNSFYNYFLLLLLGDSYYITFMIFLQIIILWLISTVLGVAAFPLLFSILPGLKDRGYSISRVVGLVLVTFLSWLLSSLKIFPFGTASVIFSLLCLICLSLWAGYRNRGELLAFLKKEFKLLLLIELIFLVALIVLLLIVALNPNIDPETERFMDYALLNSIDQTDYFPPLDPWFAGKIMNYYYYGFIFVSTLHKLIPIPLTTFFNMALALIYALFILACFGIGYNLTGKKSYGILALCAIMLIGNLNGVTQIMKKGYIHFSSFDSARGMVQIQDDGTILDYPITEFPSFSLTYGDLHPYVITYLINMAILNLLLNLALSSGSGWKMLGGNRFRQIGGLLVLSIMIGCLVGAHTWDYPVYLAVAIIILAYNQWRRLPEEGTLPVKITEFLKFLAPALVLVVLSFILYLPFNLNFISEQAGHERGGIGLVSLRTPLGLFLVAFGIYLFFQAAYIISHISKLNLQSSGAISRRPFFFFLIAALIILIAGGPGPLFGQAVLLMILLFGLTALLLLLSPLDRGEHFPLILALVAFGLTIFCEFFFLADHYKGGGYERMNTIFKLYTNVWLLLGVTAVYSVYFINKLLINTPGWKFFWKIVVGLFITAGLFFPLGATGERIRNCRNTPHLPYTLDGIEYISHRPPENQWIEWSWDQDDWQAIEWINNNITGQPVLLEAGNMGNHDGGESQAYHWASRVATFTGLPILIGWANHEAGWRNDWKEPGERKKDTELLYRTTNLNAAIHLLNKYDIRYVYIGKIERDRYPSEGLVKFNQLGELVYSDGPVEIWKMGSAGNQ